MGIVELREQAEEKKVELYILQQQIADEFMGEITKQLDTAVESEDLPAVLDGLSRWLGKHNKGIKGVSKKKEGPDKTQWVKDFLNEYDDATCTIEEFVKAYEKQFGNDKYHVYKTHGLISESDGFITLAQEFITE